MNTTVSKIPWYAKTLESSFFYIKYGRSNLSNTLTYSLSIKYYIIAEYFLHQYTKPSSPPFRVRLSLTFLFSPFLILCRFRSFFFLVYYRPRISLSYSRKVLTLVSYYFCASTLCRIISTLDVHQTIPTLYPKLYPLHFLLISSTPPQIAISRYSH